LLLYHWIRANENAVFEKIESKVDCAHITFLKLNKFKQLIAQKKEHDPLSVLKVKRSRFILWKRSYENFNVSHKKCTGKNHVGGS
jgi:hypothetical protein